MGLGMELISGRATAPGATLTALTMAAGNSLTVRFANLNSKIYLINMWAQNNAAGIFRVRSPKLHDNVQGIRYRIDAADPVPLFPLGASQILTPQDTLIAEISGSATGGQIEQGQLLIWYADLPGSNARLANWSQLSLVWSTTSRWKSRSRLVQRVGIPARWPSTARSICCRPTRITRFSAA